jgi:hypothetical protein
MTATPDEPDDSYPSSWTPAWIPKEPDTDAEIADCLRGLSAAEIQALVMQHRGDR